MASLPGGGAPSLSLRHGVRCEPGSGETVEEVLLGVGELLGCENIVSASRMNKAVVIFLKEQGLVNRLVESGLWVSGVFCAVSPLVAPTTKVTVSNVPPFIPNADIERELSRFGKFAGSIKMIPLACKNSALKHVLSFRRQVFMFLDDPTLDVSFRVWHEGLMVYATTGSLRCFECGDVGHKRQACPHKANREEAAGPSGASAEEVSNTERGTAEESEAAGPSGSSVEGVTSERSGEETVREVRGADPVLHESQVPGTSKQGVSERGDGETQVSLDRGVLQEGVIIDAPVEDVTVGEEELGDEDTCSVLSGISEFGSQSEEADLYSLQEINLFLDETFGRAVDVKDFVPDVDKFVSSVVRIQRNVGYDALSEKKEISTEKVLD